MSRANWPEKMVIIERTLEPGWTAIYVGDNNDKCFQCKVIGSTTEAAEFRVRQICAIEQMVELLKGMAEVYAAHKSANIEANLDDEYRDAYDICRQIGEVE